MGTVYKITKIFVYMIFARIKLIFTNKKNIDQNLHSRIVRSWANYTLKTIGVKVRTMGLENLPEGNCLFVGNHQSYVDIPIVLSQIDKPIGFIAKKELKKVPFISYWMKRINCVFLDRANVRDAIESINQGATNLKNLCSMLIFPEGTRSKSHEIGGFKKGSLKLALKSSVPIVPITISGSYKAYENNNNKFSPADITLVIGNPIMVDTLSKEERKDLTEKIRETIQNNYNK